MPQALLAALLIAGGGLGGLLLFNSYNQRSSAVVVAGNVAHGKALTRADLAVAEVALDGDVATIGSISEAVGKYAAHDLTAGELLTAGDLASEDQLLTEGESVIGLLLEPGEYPTKRLVAGDRVDIFAPGSEQFQPGALAPNLVVFEVVESSSDGRNLLISVVVSAEQAAAVFDAAESSGVRLSLRGEG
ncbi:MAG: SAF domain-containing protein [Acidimicrobiales bacterium]